MIAKKEITDYLRSNIYEAIAAYTGWKILKSSTSDGIVSLETAERYVGIHNNYPDFFSQIERAFLIQFVMLSLHSFDRDNRTLSLYNIYKNETEQFKFDNTDVLDKLYLLRDKLFAHRDRVLPTDILIPSIHELDQFFKKLINFYNTITLVVDRSNTIFSNAEDIKNDIEYVFMDLYRGDYYRKRVDQADFLWEKNSGKVSDVVRSVTK
jgi:hypothetical protein